MKAEKSEPKIRMNRHGKPWQEPKQRYKQVAKYSHPSYVEAHGHCQMLSGAEIEAYEQGAKRIRIRRRRTGFDVIVLKRIHKEKKDGSAITEHVG